MITTAGTHRVTLSAAGNVGIGTTTPGEKLEVNTAAQSAIMLRARYNAGYYTDYGSNQLNFTGAGQSYGIKNNGTFALFINSSSNVGIGETLPDRKLHVNSGTENANTIFESTDVAVTIRLKDSTGSAEIESRNDFRFSNNAGADQRMVISSAGAIRFNDYGAGTLVSDAFR